jgi:hypothetical protein
MISSYRKERANEINLGGIPLTGHDIQYCVEIGPARLYIKNPALPGNIALLALRKA